ncbi:hypothetical protein [Glutamicibacter sp.]|uniref:hypothetical protein n=1 Tax=Glutamicibacter sp. TaxID=1931995 RepID=UPI003D6A482B
MPKAHLGKIAVLAFTGLLCLSACSAGIPEAGESDAPVPSAGEYLPLLAQPQSDEDKLPEGFEDTESYDAETRHLLATSDFGRHYVAVGSEGQLCMVAIPKPTEEDGDYEIAGTTCPTMDYVVQNGVPLKVDGGENSLKIVTYLMPAGVSDVTVKNSISGLRAEHPELEAEDIQVVAENDSVLLVMEDSTARALGTITINRPGGDPLVLASLT